MLKLERSMSRVRIGALAVGVALDRVVIEGRDIEHLTRESTGWGTWTKLIVEDSDLRGALPALKGWPDEVLIRWSDRAPELFARAAGRREHPRDADGDLIAVVYRSREGRELHILND